jgi:hypothetical protein
MPHRRVGTKSEPSQFISEYEHDSRSQLLLSRDFRVTYSITYLLTLYS